MENKRLWAIHSWVGLYAGVAIAFLSVTGVAALFRVEADHLLNPRLRSVKPAGNKVPMTPVVEKVRALHPDKQLFEVELPKTVDGTWNIRLMARERDLLFPVLWEVFVHPYTGEVLGERNYYTTFNFFLRNIHVRFYEAWYGRQIVGLAGLALLISTITGFLIYGKFMKKQFFGSIRKHKLRVEQADFHKLIGITALLFNLMIAITGAWLGLQGYLQRWLSIERPNTYVVAEKPLDAEEDLHYAFNYDSVYAATTKNFPELIPLHIRPSNNGDRTVTVLGNVPGQVYERSNNKIVFDKPDYQMLFKYNINKGDFGDKVFYVQEALHFGDFGGIALKVLYSFLGLTSGFLSITGFVVYLERTKKQRQAQPKFVALKPLLWRWGGSIIGFCIITGILSVTWGIGIPSLLVMITFYGAMIFLLLRAFYRNLKWRLVNLKRQTA